jgi:hypothetical protein
VENQQLVAALHSYLEELPKRAPLNAIIEPQGGGGIKFLLPVLTDSPFFRYLRADIQDWSRKHGLVLPDFTSGDIKEILVDMWGFAFNEDIATIEFNAYTGRLKATTIQVR